MALREICGCIHLHTTFSDGGCDYPTLIKAARGAGLDYIGVTDHMTLKAQSEHNAGLRDGVLVLIGYEHNDERNLNHYLAFGTNEIVEGVTDPQEYIDQIKKKGGIGFLAHPAEKRDFFGNLPASMCDAPPLNDTIKSIIKGGATAPPYPWTRWDAKGYDGIELWNQMSDWMEQLSGWQSVIRLFYPRRFLANVPQNLLAKWDEMNRFGFISGIGGVDAHTRKFTFGPFYYTIFPIKVELRGIRTHLYIDESMHGDEAKMTQAALEALKNGRGFISNFHQGDARGALIYSESKNGTVQYPGRSTGIIDQPQTLNVKLPHKVKARIRFLRNGEEVQSAQDCEAQLKINEPGVYRAEVYKGSNAWIYSNPFPVGAYPL